MKKCLILAYAFGIFISIFFHGVNFLSRTSPREEEAFPVSAAPFTFGRAPGPAGEPTFMYRGSPSRSGVIEGQEISPRLVEEWRGPPLNVGVHDASKASPAVDASGVYVGYDSGWFEAYDLSGARRWRYYASDAARGIHGTAALDDTSVYVGTYGGDLISFDKGTGRVRWVNKVGDAVGSSPLLYEDSILITAETSPKFDGYLVRLDRATGKVLWRSEPLGEQSHSSPALDPETRYIFLGANNDKYFSFSYVTGVKIWEKTADGKIKGTMAVAGGRIYFTTWGGSLYCADARSGEVIWKAKLERRSQSSPLLLPEQNLVVVGEPGAVEAVDSRTGAPRWKIPTGSPLTFRASGVAARWKSEWLVLTLPPKTGALEAS